MSKAKAPSILFIATCLIAAGSVQRLLAEEEEPLIPPEQGCTFRADPAEFLNAQSRVREAIHRRVKTFSGVRASGEENPASDAPAIVRRSFVDEEIFGKLQQKNVAPARLTTDEEFIRRIYLDLIGRIPSAAEVRAFVSSAVESKRDQLIETLLVTPEFNDKWAVWFEDLVGMTENPATQRRPQIEGRNSFDFWIREQLRNNRPMTEIVMATLTGRGNNYFIENAPANFLLTGSATMGPAQDTYDLMLVKSVTAYLGVGHYDCLLCHSGRNHLEPLTLWGSRGLRVDAQRMAAHFARTRLTTVPGTLQYMSVLYNSTDIQDVAAGTYDLNTTSGNRPNRTPVGTERNLTPEYRDGTKAAGNWRTAFAGKLISDPLFAINFTNRVWKEFFGMGLIDPVDTIDPDRLDPKNPPPAPWTLQPSHPELLQRLAQFFVEHDTNLRELIRLLVQSSAYQLSSRYDREWKLENVPLFARHYPRRLDAEEVHDALVGASGVLPRYTWPKVNGQTVTQGSVLPQSEPVNWAMQLPDINEPRGTAALTFLNTFTRGNRSTTQRTESGSILQQLSLMNDNFVLSRIRIANSPNLKELVRITDNATLVEELWLTFLSRRPTESELAKAVAHLAKATNAAGRNTAIEDVTWAAINKVDFLFSY